MQRLGNPYPVFFDATGTLAYGNQVYIGEANADPQVDPIVVYWDSELTQVAAQPLQTIGGRIVNGSTPADVFFAESDFSLRQLDPFDVLVYYSPSVFDSGIVYQPLDDDLTAISGSGTASFGRSLLGLANQQALVSATGLPTPLPLAGGTVTGQIYKQGFGGAYFGASGLTGCTIYVVATGTADPTAAPGDLVFYY